LRVISFEKRVRRGDTSCAVSCSSLLVSALFRLKRTEVILPSVSPTLSSAAIVLSKCVGSSLSLISFISSQADLIASSIAGLK
jgi:hypothetical protein